MSTVAEEKLNSILAGLEEPVCDELHAAFNLLNALEFAKRLHRADIPDEIKSALLALKVSAPTQSNSDALQVVLDKSVAALWDRLGDPNAVEAAMGVVNRGRD